MQVKLDDKGDVSDASVLSGPDELRKASIQSVLNWHFTKDAAGGSRQVRIAFELPKPNATTPGVVGGVVSGVPGGVISGVPDGVHGGVIGGIVGSVPSRMPVPNEGTLRNINVYGLSDQVRSELLSRLPVHVGDTVSGDQIQKVREAVSEYDEHLAVRFGFNANKEATLTIQAPGGGGTVMNGVIGSVPEAAVPPGAIKVGGNVQQAMLLEQPHPVYPPLAKQARIQGTVTLNAIIGKDGHVVNLSAAKGHPLLIQAAMDAVKDWVYKPTLMNGSPVEVVTVIDVNFTLSE